jgi:ElaB/YqjD/DUF883 family membrane-anchored ribosome-binding protein
MAFWNKNNKQIEENQNENINLDNVKKTKVPLLILDKNWHYMFPPGKKTERMLELEAKLNELLKEQGKLTNNEKDYKKFKKECMSNIMGQMEAAYDNGDNKAKQDMEKSQKYIEEVNEKLEEIEDRLYSLPKEMKQANDELLKESVSLSYAEMRGNKKRVEELDKEILELRETLKDRISEKTTKQEMVDRTYMFLHNMVGVEVINKLDSQNME